MKVWEYWFQYTAQHDTSIGLISSRLLLVNYPIHILVLNPFKGIHVIVHTGHYYKQMALSWKRVQHFSCQFYSRQKWPGQFSHTNKFNQVKSWPRGLAESQIESNPTKFLNQVLRRPNKQKPCLIFTVELKAHKKWISNQVMYRFPSSNHHHHHLPIWMLGLKTAAHLMFCISICPNKMKQNNYPFPNKTKIMLPNLVFSTSYCWSRNSFNLL